MEQTDDTSKPEQVSEASTEKAVENATNQAEKVAEKAVEKERVRYTAPDIDRTPPAKFDLSEVTEALAALPEQVARAVREAFTPPETAKPEPAKAETVQTAQSNSSPDERKSFADRWFS